MKVKDVLSAWESLSILSTSASIPTLKGQYSISRAYDKLKPSIDPLFKQRKGIYEEYYEIEDKTGIVKDLKENVDKAEFDKKIEEFNEMDIQVDIYKINLNDLEGTKIILKDKEISLPPIHLSYLKDFIIDLKLEPSK